VTLLACGPASDAVCGRACDGNATSGQAAQARYAWMGDGSFLDEQFTCPRKGSYLRSFVPSEAVGPGNPQCDPCPPGLAGLDGVLCSACPARQVPHADGASCVCAPPGELTWDGACACPAGMALLSPAGCEPCPPDTAWAAGRCEPCPPGNTSAAGALACADCPAGAYRAAGQRGCAACGPGLYPADAGDPQSCVACLEACPNWLSPAPCPVNASLVVCRPCPSPLPSNAAWVAEPGASCAYRCLPGHFHADNRACLPCTDEPCPAGFARAACTSFRDGDCETPCVNGTMPAQHAVWADGCGWACEAGYRASFADYLVFSFYECVPA
jgi:hypothetical protein